MEGAAGRGAGGSWALGRKGPFRASLHPSSPPLPVSGALELTVSPAWPRSLRMPRGKSLRPTSRHRAPRRQRLPTGLTCMSSRSPRSPCPWPSSLGAQVSEPPGGAGAARGQCSRGGRQGAGMRPLLQGPGALGACLLLGWHGLLPRSWDGHLCAGRWGFSVALGMLDPGAAPPPCQGGAPCVGGAVNGPFTQDQDPGVGTGGASSRGFLSVSPICPVPGCLHQADHPRGRSGA